MEIKELLPIGSIVKIEELEDLFIITSRIHFYPTSNFDLGYVDYKAFEYPGGDNEEAQDYTFNHEDISEVVFRGYQDEDDRDYLLELEEIIQKEEVIHLTMDEVNEMYEEEEVEEEVETSNIFSRLFHR